MTSKNFIIGCYANPTLQPETSTFLCLSCMIPYKRSRAQPRKLLIYFFSSCPNILYQASWQAHRGQWQGTNFSSHSTMYFVFCPLQFWFVSSCKWSNSMNKPYFLHYNFLVPIVHSKSRSAAAISFPLGFSYNWQRHVVLISTLRCALRTYSLVWPTLRKKMSPHRVEIIQIQWGSGVGPINQSFSSAK